MLIAWPWRWGVLLDSSDLWSVKWASLGDTRLLHLAWSPDSENLWPLWRVGSTNHFRITKVTVISLDNAHKRYKCPVILGVSTGGRYNYRLQSLNLIGPLAGKFRLVTPRCNHSLKPHIKRCRLVATRCIYRGLPCIIQTYDRDLRIAISLTIVTAIPITTCSHRATPHT
jgi:hypothetical protein